VATFTLTALQSALTAYETAFEARDWDTALNELNTYGVIYAGLFKRGGLDNATLENPDPKVLLESFEKLRVLAQLTASDRRRTIVGRTNWGVPGG